MLNHNCQFHNFPLKLCDFEIDLLKSRDKYINFVEPLIFFDNMSRDRHNKATGF